MLTIRARSVYKKHWPVTGFLNLPKETCAREYSQRLILISYFDFGFGFGFGFGFSLDLGGKKVS